MKQRLAESMQNRRGLAGIILVGFLALGWIVSSWPVTTRQGIDYRISSHTQPLYVKVLAFLHRHTQYQLLTREITRGLAADSQRVEAILAWTRQNIREVPKNFPVVDDHILNIVIRGYGTEDQMADVFATLCTYSGIPAFWELFTIPVEGGKKVFSFAHIDGRWAVFDVEEGSVFKNAQGGWAEVGDLIQDPALASPYEDFFREPARGFYWRPFRPPEKLRAKRQMPWERLWDEIRRGR